MAFDAKVWVARQARVKPSERVPDLRLLRTERIHFHERAERSRTLRLVDRLRKDLVLQNPPIVAALGGDEWILLDGANRVSAFREIGWTHVPVQAIDYASARVELRGWHHLLLEGETLDLRASYAALEGVRIAGVAEDELARLLELREAYAVLVDHGGNAWGLFPASGVVEVVEWMEILERIVAAYEGRARLERIKIADYANPLAAFRAVEHQLVLFPTITKAELLALSRSGTHIPTGITRHLIPGRALGLNLPLGFLQELGEDGAKEAHFRQFVHGLEIAGRIRYYEESVFIMNE